MKEKIEYKSKDNYFDVIEKFTQDKKSIIVTYIYSAIIDGIENFKTIYEYNLKGNLIKYSNSYGVIIEHHNKPIVMLTKPKILQ